MGLRRGRMQRFVKQYANLAKIIGDAAAAYVDEVRMGVFPDEQNTFASTIPTTEAKS
jgi:3-methyl-2-oxobutanoate hydroxymethyltransferase